MSWEYFDAIFCINLEKDFEKRKKVTSIFQQLKIPVLFFKGIKKDISDYGCLESHKAIYNYSLKKGYDKILIFEDDIIPNMEIISKKIEHCVNFMEKYPWDIFYLGATPSILSYYQNKTIMKDIYKIKGICTHAYALKKSALEKLKNIEWKEDNPLDYQLRDNDSLESYAIYPSLFYQKTCYNFPENVIVNSMWLNEFYAYYIGIPVKYSIIFLIIIIIFLRLKKFKFI